MVSALAFFFFDVFGSVGAGGLEFWVEDMIAELGGYRMGTVDSGSGDIHTGKALKSMKISLTA